MTKYYHFAKLSLQNASFTHIRMPARTFHNILLIDLLYLFGFIYFLDGR